MKDTPTKRLKVECTSAIEMLMVQKKKEFEVKCLKSECPSSQRENPHFAALQVLTVCPQQRLSCSGVRW